MDKDFIVDKVRDILSERCNIKKEVVGLDVVLADYLGVDSLVIVEIIYELEEAFGVEIASQDFQGVKTVGDIVNYINGQMFLS